MESQTKLFQSSLTPSIHGPLRFHDPFDSLDPFDSNLQNAQQEDNLFKINTSDGSGSLIGGLGFRDVFGLATPNGIDLFGLFGTEVLSVDPSTGSSTSILDYSGEGLFRANGSAFVSEAVVPIPAAGWLFGSGLLALLGIKKSLQKSKKA